jgi:hypothetical protein
MDLMQELLLGLDVRKSDTIRTASMVASRVTNYGMDGVTISDCIIYTLDQKTCSSLATTKT